MQALILAAGLGSRLGNLTESQPKCMVEVDSVSMIERMLRQLDHRDFTRIVIVDGYKNDTLEAFIKDMGIKTPIHFVTNEIYNKTNNIYSLMCAKDYFVEEDTLLLESDLIFDERLLDLILTNPYENAALVDKYKAWMDGTVVQIDENDGITDFIGKNDFNYLQKESYYKTINIYKLSKKFIQDVYMPFLEAHMQSVGVNSYYESAFKYIVNSDDFEFKAVVNNAINWYEVDDKQDLDIAQVMFASDITRKLELMQRRFGGYWRYPTLIDFCYLVNPFYPNQRLLDEIKSNFERLVCDYPSGMGVNTLLAAKHFKLRENQIVIGNGAAELIKSLMESLEGTMGVITPTFEEYPNRCPHLNLIQFDTSKLDYQYQTDDIISYFDDKKLDHLVLINPDNPSGNYIKKDDVLRLLDWTSTNDIKLILDESFIDFVGIEAHGSLLQEDILDKYPNLYLVKSISKSYGVPGFRLGILATSDSDTIAFIKKDVSIWNINSFGEYYMQIVDKYTKDFAVAMDKFRNVRAEYVYNLSKIPGIKVYPSQANYIMLKIQNGKTARYVTERLLADYDVFIKDLSPKAGFEGEYIRVAVKRPEENNQLINALITIMKEA